MRSKITKRHYEYPKEIGNLKVGTYEVNQLARLCGISTATLVCLGSRANAVQAPIAIRDCWYIYALEERHSKGKTEYYLTIDNTIKY